MTKTLSPSYPTVLLTDIVIRSNTRKIFDEDAIQELAESIKTNGVLQPVLLRPLPKGKYELVCGERRYRASIIAAETHPECKNIPATIREMTDEQVLDAQIIENLQRKDVHPMDEAFAIKSMLDSGKSMEDIAVRLGKKIYFARQRNVLNDLTPGWQKVFYHNGITITDALKIAVLSSDDQTELWEKEDLDVDKYDGGRKITFGTWQMERLKGNLATATFPLDDASIVTSAGACSTCQFNSAVSNLFPEQEASPKCNKVSCFKEKTDKHYDAKLQKAIEDPTILLVNDYWSVSSDTNKLIKKGVQVLMRGDFEAVLPPDKIGSWEEWEEQNSDEFDTYDEARKEYEKDLAQYQKDLQEYNEKIGTGKYIKAFSVESDTKGHYIYISLKKKAAAAKSAAASKGATQTEQSVAVSIQEIDEEIKRLRDREKRNKELDQEKVQARISETVKADKAFKELPKKATPTDKVLLRFLLGTIASYINKDLIKKVTGLSIDVYGDGKSPEAYYKGLESLSDEQVAFITRRLVIDMCNTALPHGTKGYMFRKMSELTGTVPIEAYEIEQKEVAVKRAAKVDGRIVALQAKKKELQAAAKSTKVPSAPKKAAKK